MFRRYISFVALFLYVSVAAVAQINTERVTRMGRNAMYYEDYVVSIQYFNQVISAKPYLYEPYYLRGLAKFYLGDYKGAEADCTMAIERNPFVVTTYNIRGLARINMNNFDGAAQDYSNITRNDPDNQTIWHDSVICYLNAKQYNQADSTLNVIIGKWPKYSKAFTLKAQLALQRQDTIKAEENLSKSL
ncbi:MAG: tetratricopeptide repeat protein, partial [Bacteroidaceae bacterium]|nr:tetratricopeptide repeat protein [Bacteroidaceae bacterium]